MDFINISCIHKYNQTKMSNIFKPNSRFSALLEDNKDFKKQKGKKTNEKEQLDAIKSSERKDSRFKPYDERELGIKRQNNFEKKEKEKQKEKDNEKKKINLEPLNMDDFPELISSVKKNDNKEQYVSYMDALKKKEEVKDIIDDHDLMNLEPGWLLIKKDPQTGNTIMKYGPGTVLYEEQEPKKTEKELLLDAVDALIELHEQRTDEYIELNGYDVWEKMFKYPNWQEREAYLYEEEEESEDSFDENDEYDEDYYDEYDDEYDDYY